MRLVELKPRWWGDGRRVLGMSFVCPLYAAHNCGHSFCRLGVTFANPPDGGPPGPVVTDTGMPKLIRDLVHEVREFDVPPGHRWTRSGDTWDALTLTPSIDASKAGCWHGHITNGDVR